MLKPAVKLAGFALVACAPAAWAQQYTISTVAGGAPPPTPASATATSIGQPRRVALDSAGNVYFSSGNSVFKISGSTLSLVAGNSRPGFAGDGGAAVSAELNEPQGLAVDKSGNIYIADSVNNRVRIVNAQGIINTFAGNGQVGAPGYFGDGFQATAANLLLPGGVTVDGSGNVYIADTGDNQIRKVTTDGVINAIAGDGYPSFGGDAGLASASELNHPEDVAVDSSGNVYIADTGNAAIRKITTDNNINTVAGDGSIGYSGDGGTSLKAGLIEPFAIAVDGAGNIFIAEPEDGRIRKADTAGNINTVAGNGTLGFGGDGSAATGAQMRLPTGVAVDSSGNLYIADGLNQRIRKVASSSISTIAGNGFISYAGDNGPAVSAELSAPQAVAVDASGNLYIADTVNNAVRMVTAKGVITTIAGNGNAGSTGDNGAATSATLNSPQGIAVDASGNVYVSDTASAKVRKISNGTITTVAGSGTLGYAGDGGAATSAQLNTPVGLAIDKSGNLYIADLGNNVVRMVTPGGTISTFAGTTQGYSGDGGPAAAARLAGPQGVGVDSLGNVFIADTLNAAVREVTSNGVIATIAGTGFAGFSGDGGAAAKAQLGSPTGLAVDSAGTLYVADSGGRVRKIFPGGVIVTIGGNNVRAYAGDGGPATSGSFAGAQGVAVDAAGDVFVADTGNNAIRELRFSASSATIAAVTNSATNLTGAIAPGEVVVLYGSNIGAAKLTTYSLNSTGLVGASLAGTSVYFNGIPGPVIYTSPSQVGAVVPFNVTGTAASVYIVNQGATTVPVVVPIAAASPSIFTLSGAGTGQAAAINQDGSINGSASPAKIGSTVQIYATGFGQTNPTGQDGLPNAVPLPLPVLPVSVTIGGKSAKVGYDGGAPGLVAGVMQVNAVIPGGLSAGAQPVVITVGTLASTANVTIVVTP